MGGSRLDQTDDFQKFCRSALDRIQFFQMRIGLELKNFLVHSSLHTSLCVSVTVQFDILQNI